MKAKSKKGFTLIELLVVITIIAMLAAGAYAGFGAIMPGVRAKQAASQATNIHKWLVGYALENGGGFPEGENANAAYRELFKKSLGADEKQFAIPNDPYHKGTPKNGPDGDIGREPEYTQALEQGENAFAYVSGLSNSDEGRLPIIANGFVPGSAGVWTKEKRSKGGVFEGKKAVVCLVSGSSQAHDLNNGVYEVKGKYNGAEVNVFSTDYGTPATVLDPL